jgi:hypothetical protein
MRAHLRETGHIIVGLLTIRCNRHIAEGRRGETVQPTNREAELTSAGSLCWHQC